MANNPISMELHFGTGVLLASFWHWWWMGGPINNLLAGVAAFGIPAFYLTFVIPERTVAERGFLRELTRSEGRQVVYGILYPPVICGGIKFVWWVLGGAAPPPYWICGGYYLVNGFFYPGFIQVGMELANHHQRNQIRMEVIKKTVLSSLLVGCLYFGLFNFASFGAVLVDRNLTFVSPDPIVLIQSALDGMHARNSTREPFEMGEWAWEGLEQVNVTTGQKEFMPWEVLMIMFYFHFRKVAVMSRLIVYLLSMVVLGDFV